MPAHILGTGGIRVRTATNYVVLKLRNEKTGQSGGPRIIGLYGHRAPPKQISICLLYTSDAADE